jgi:HD-like signal output (HDOD) protein/prolyl-tRNA editing enzyme YbaK/EbsC (Cys-tRNA(Pro) deacylase)
MDQGHYTTDNLPTTILTYLKKHRVAYQPLRASASTSLSNDMKQLQIEPHQLVRAVLLQHANAHLLAILPYDQAIDFSELKKLFKADYLIASPELLPEIFFDCDSETIPPFGEAYQIPTVVDASIMEKERLYLQPGRKGLFLQLTTEEFGKLFPQSPFKRFSSRVSEIATLSPSDASSSSEIACDEIEKRPDFERYMPVADLRQQLDRFCSLPVPSPIVAQILSLKGDSSSTLDQLVEIVSDHPALSKQLQLFSTLPFFGGYDRKCALRDTIQQLLGVRIAQDTALGLASLHHFHLHEDGPLGRTAFWKHALYTTLCALEMSREMPRALRPEAGTVILSTLLHNIGFMLLGDLFRPEFFLLNKLVEANPEMAVTQLEHQLLGMGTARHLINMGHSRLGAWLMHAWEMPDPVIMTVAEHHNPRYEARYALYPRLTLLADRLILRLRLGDAESSRLPKEILDELALCEEGAEQALERVKASRSILDQIVALS